METYYERSICAKGSQFFKLKCCESHKGQKKLIVSLEKITVFSIQRGRDQQQKAKAAILTPMFPWETPLEQFWLKTGWIVLNKSASAEVSQLLSVFHGSLWRFPRESIAFLPPLISVLFAELCLRRKLNSGSSIQDASTGWTEQFSSQFGCTQGVWGTKSQAVVDAGGEKEPLTPRFFWIWIKAKIMESRVSFTRGK